ncbi:MAG: alanyl-tRNA synthetase [Microgenomates bacterium 39_7]|nr:MAG: alanyl-tRNA synthetase [Microgenomates bacterium 39_7]
MSTQNSIIHNANALRQAYLDFFSQKDHAIVPSSLLVPENDPTTLFTTAGMQPMMPYLLGNKHPKGTRIVDSQKCFRAQDIEEVGDNRHTTFFEMLGNWSLGDYFKKEQLSWFFEFLTDVVGLSPSRIYVTVFAGSKKYQIQSDQEAVLIWKELFSQKGIEAEEVKDPLRIDIDLLKNPRIFHYKYENWWSRAGEPDNMPLGEPGGPDSEIFYDFGSDFKFHENSPYANQPCHLNCNCGRFMEIGNSVFMQYVKTENGFKDLPQKNIDFGGGLERILAAAQHQPDVFQTELFYPIIGQIEQFTNKSYQDNLARFRIIADHIKAAVMLISDGVMPSNKDQGYMVRRLLRRSIRQASHLSQSSQFITSLVEVVSEIYRQPYPQVAEKKTDIEQVVTLECEKFGHTLNKGLREFNKLTQETKILSGDMAYHLYETYGFPIEVLLEEARLNQINISEKFDQEFKKAKDNHQEASRQGAQEKFQGGLVDHSTKTTAYHTVTHLLHAALRKILGDQVEQKGSNITAERLRFDFTHPQAMTDEEIAQVESLINEWITQDLSVCKVVMSKEEALNSGALAFFAERYPERVSVYIIGNFSGNQLEAEDVGDNSNIVSKELCGGPHVESTGEIGLIKIFKEKSASAGVRRVYLKNVDRT